MAEFKSLLSCFFIYSMLISWYAGTICFGLVSPKHPEDCSKCVIVGGLNDLTSPTIAAEDIDKTKSVKYAGPGINGVNGVPAASTISEEDIDETKYFEPTRPGHSSSPSHSDPTKSKGIAGNAERANGILQAKGRRLRSLNREEECEKCHDMGRAGAEGDATPIPEGKEAVNSREYREPVRPSHSTSPGHSGEGKGYGKPPL